MSSTNADSAIVKNTAKRYMAFAGYGLAYIILMAVLDNAESFAFLKFARLFSRHIFKISPQVYSIGQANLLFLAFVIVQTFLMLTIPIIITEKKILFKAIAGSITIGGRNFLKVFCLVFIWILFRMYAFYSFWRIHAKLFNFKLFELLM